MQTDCFMHPIDHREVERRAASCVRQGTLLNSQLLWLAFTRPWRVSVGAGQMCLRTSHVEGARYMKKSPVILALLLAGSLWAQTAQAPPAGAAAGGQQTQKKEIKDPAEYN